MTCVSYPLTISKSGELINEGGLGGTRADMGLGAGGPLLRTPGAHSLHRGPVAARLTKEGLLVFGCPVGIWELEFHFLIMVAHWSYTVQTMWFCENSCFPSGSLKFWYL